MFYLYLILIYIMYVSYKCSNAIQETRIPSEMCAGETCITDGKHASLVIYVCGETRIPRDTGFIVFTTFHDPHNYVHGTGSRVRLPVSCT